MDKKALFRIRLICLGIIAFCGLLVTRLFFIQLVVGDDYRARANRQYQGPATPVRERRAIYFQTKDGQLVSAATTQNAFILALNPNRLEDPELVYDRLTEILPLERTLFFEKAGKHDDPHEELATNLDEATAERIKNLKLVGVQLIASRTRAYPAGSLAAHAIGFLGYEDKDLVGRYGLEREYNQLLMRSQDKSFAQFLGEAFAEIRGTVFRSEVDATDEADLVLTIEPTVQQSLESEIASLAERHRADSVGGIIMDPQTGEIVALAAWPTFHPGERQGSLEALRNPLVENVYEMGSIIKPLTLASALDAGVLTASTTYFDAGSVTVGGRKIANYDGRGRGTVTMQEALNQSLNTGMVFAAERLGPATFRRYLSAFGLDETTGVDLPNEAKGLLGNLASGRAVEFATASFGQGIALSPLATVTALAALGNGGRLLEPHVVKRLERDNAAASVVIEPKVRSQAISPETSQEITRMLVRVVDEALVGGQAKLERYSIAAKTGTAQMPRPDGGGYYEDRFLHSFFGYWPASAPRFITFLYLVNPQDVDYASETLTRPFMDLTKFLINYYHLPPDR
jgi:cell division protein FtsI/penicillin-binding protein 2